MASSAHFFTTSADIRDEAGFYGPSYGPIDSIKAVRPQDLRLPVNQPRRIR